MTHKMLLSKAAAAGFTPAAITDVIAWWDASDAASFTYSSGTLVSQWASRVGSATLIQSLAGVRPDRSGSVNGLATVVFDGLDDSMSLASLDMTAGGQKFSLWAAFTCVSGGDRIIMEQTTNYNSNPGSFILLRSTGNIVDLTKRGGGTYSGFQTTGTVTTTPKLFVGTHDGTLVSNETTGWLATSSAGSRPVNDNTSLNNLSAALYVGAPAGSSLFLNGQILDMGITLGVMSSGDRADLETYISAKWAI